MRSVGLGIQSFAKIRQGNQLYVDKTGFIGEWYRKNDDITLITRPRRFGKTLTLDMLHCFFSSTYADRKDLFVDLEIGRDKMMMQMQGTVPVIRISFSGVKGVTFDHFLIEIAGKIAEVLYQFRYLLEGNVLTDKDKELFLQLSQLSPDIPDREKNPGKYASYVLKLTKSLHFLSLWLSHFHGQKVYIFMDEYDTPLQTAYLRHFYQDAVEIMRAFFSETFKDNPWMSRAVITGITRIAKESLFSEMNNLAVYSVISGGYDTAFGFTEGEMNDLMMEYGLQDQRDLVRFWYDGFTIGRAKAVYNPWSVINYLAKPYNPPTDYWAQSGGLGLVDHLIRRGSMSLKEGFQTLLEGGSINKRIREDLIFPQLDSDENAVWSLLIAAGYVKPVLENEAVPFASGKGADSGLDFSKTPFSFGLRTSKTRIALTNHESLVCLSEMVTGWFRTRDGNYMEGFAEAVLANDLEAMNEQLQRIVTECVSVFDSGRRPSGGGTRPENYFHGLTLGMLTCLSDDYRMTSNRESGFGRYDISLTPLDPRQNPYACIFEFKIFSKKEKDETLEDTAMRARQQIDDCSYDTELIAAGFPKDRIRKYGIGFCGKRVMIVT